MTPLHRLVTGRRDGDDIYGGKRRFVFALHAR